VTKSHVLAQTTHDVAAAAPYGFACVVIPAVIEIRSEVLKPRGSKLGHSHYSGH